MDLRHSFDITPWDKNGHSFLGLNRKQAKWLALGIIFLALNFADPPGGLNPFNDFLNFWLGDKLALWFGGSSTWWIIFTYTLLPIMLLLLGAWIYPHNTHSILNGYVNKFQAWLRKILHNPLYLGLLILSCYLFYTFYSAHLRTVLP